MKRGNLPYKKLGDRLYQIRCSLKESLVEVSGAVELDSDIIDSYERGETRPSEDILEQLINHFEIVEDEADELYELAGYTETMPMAMPSVDPAQVPTVVVVPIDSKVVYTDTVNVSINDYGVVMNFMQSGHNAGNKVPVSRVGMSLEHAKSVLQVLQKTINEAERRPKQLPPSEKQN